MPARRAESPQPRAEVAETDLPTLQEFVNSRGWPPPVGGMCITSHTRAMVCNWGGGMWVGGWVDWGVCVCVRVCWGKYGNMDSSL